MYTFYIQLRSCCDGALQWPMHFLTSCSGLRSWPIFLGIMLSSPWALSEAVPRRHGAGQAVARALFHTGYVCGAVYATAGASRQEGSGVDLQSSAGSIQCFFSLVGNGRCLFASPSHRYNSANMHSVPLSAITGPETCKASCHSTANMQVQRRFNWLPG